MKWIPGQRMLPLDATGHFATPFTDGLFLAWHLALLQLCIVLWKHHCAGVARVAHV